MDDPVETWEPTLKSHTKNILDQSLRIFDLCRLSTIDISFE